MHPDNDVNDPFRPYSHADWMLLLVLGTLLVEGLFDPSRAAVMPIVVALIAVMMRLAMYLLRFLPCRGFLHYFGPAIIIGGVFQFGLEGLSYYLDHTVFARSGEAATCPVSPRDREAPQTPLPGPSELAELGLARK
jgi:hypothetical protein